MPPRISWRKLLPGIAAFAAVVLIAIGVLVFAGVGEIRGEKVRLYVLTDQARGVLHGTEVWLAGQKIGLVDDITFRAPSTDTGARVVIAVRVRKRDAEQIRRDTHAQVRPGLNFIGPVVVYLFGGTVGSPQVRARDTLRAGAQSDIEAAGAKVNAASAELGPLVADARTVVRRVRDTNGTIGALLTGHAGGEVAKLRSHLVRVSEVTHDGHEEPANPMSVMRRVRVALARADSVRTLLQSSNRSYGRFRRDSTLGGAVASVRDEIAELRATLADSSGTLGRYARDSALSRSMADVHAEMTLLFNDIRRRPLRYVHF